jgi:deoxyribose-phosphate aldolase
MDCTLDDIAKMIDHSLLQPSMIVEKLEEGIRLARQYSVASVCVLPYYLRRCSELLQGSDVRPSTVIGFPHGSNTTNVKLAEAQQAIDDGGVELDMVVNISKVLSGDWRYVSDEIRAVVEKTHDCGGKVKVIFENCYLQNEHKIRLCEICGELKADWVKTSTGFGTGGATVEDVLLMRDHSPPRVQVKAAGGIRSLDMVLLLRKAGATRIGCSATAEVLEECRRRQAED